MPALQHAACGARALVGALLAGIELSLVNRKRVIRYEERLSDPYCAAQTNTAPRWLNLAPGGLPYEVAH